MRFQIIAAVVFSVLLLASAAFAQQAQQSAMGQQILVEFDDDSGVSFEGVSIAELEGKGVYTEGGEKLGEVEEFLGTDQGELEAFVMEVDHGFLDLQEKKFVIPAERLRLDPDQSAFVSDFTPEDIAGFEPWEN